MKRLVFDKEIRTANFPNVMIQSTGSHQKGIASDTKNYFFGKVSNLHGMLKGSGCLLGQFTEQRLITVGYLN